MNAIDFHRFQWTPLDFNRFVQVHMDFHTLLCFIVGLHGFLWILSISQDPHGFLMGIHVNHMKHPNLIEIRWNPKDFIVLKNEKD